MILIKTGILCCHQINYAYTSFFAWIRLLLLSTFVLCHAPSQRAHQPQFQFNLTVMMNRWENCSAGKYAAKLLMHGKYEIVKKNTAQSKDRGLISICWTRSNLASLRERAVAKFKIKVREVRHGAHKQDEKGFQWKGAEYQQWQKMDDWEISIPVLLRRQRSGLRQPLLFVQERCENQTRRHFQHEGGS